MSLKTSTHHISYIMATQNAWLYRAAPSSSSSWCLVIRVLVTQLSETVKNTAVLLANLTCVIFLHLPSSLKITSSDAWSVLFLRHSSASFARRRRRTKTSRRTRSTKFMNILFLSFNLVHHPNMLRSCALLFLIIQRSIKQGSRTNQNCNLPPICCLLLPLHGVVGWCSPPEQISKAHKPPLESRS